MQAVLSGVLHDQEDLSLVIYCVDYIHNVSMLQKLQVFYLSFDILHSLRVSNC